MTCGQWGHCHIFSPAFVNVMLSTSNPPYGGAHQPRPNVPSSQYMAEMESIMIRVISKLLSIGILMCMNCAKVDIFDDIQLQQHAWIDTDHELLCVT